jgi:hypothetical protein
VAGTATVPANATGIAGNLTATRATTGSFVTAFPRSATRPGTSTLNIGPDQTVANAIALGLGTGQIDLANENGSVDLVLDIAGYYAPT